MTNKIFALDYLDWCRKTKGVKSIKETENRRDWIQEFYYSEDWNQQEINGLDYMQALGGYHG